MEIVWKCGHTHTPAAPDFDPETDADWCARHSCPSCRKARARAARTREELEAARREP